MDLNVVAIAGALATAPELRTFESGASLARLLVSVRAEAPHARTDVVPVTVWDPDEVVRGLVRGDRVCVTGTVQRRFWKDGSGRRSAVEVVAHDIGFPGVEAA